MTDKDRRGRPPTPGERAEKWLTNCKLVISLYAALGFGTLYGVNDTVRTKVNTWIGKAPIETADLESAEHQKKVLALLIEKEAALEEQDKEMQRLIFGHYDKLQAQIDELKQWHK
ncbi:hypothetical protein [Neptunomonas sp.]|uniref:hypothetical protein n=1 Tax=Neptunomonas sp. TaxID=1971898 RepID=UPI003563B764